MDSHVPPSFLLIEPEVFVMSDITEILKDGFPGCVVTPIDAPTALSDWHGYPARDTIVVLSVPSRSLATWLQELEDRLPSASLILIDADFTRPELSARQFASVTKPFGAHGLLAAVRNVLSYQQQPRS